jgi:hypothetical protein
MKIRWSYEQKWLFVIMACAIVFLTLHMQITAQSLQTVRTILNNVWDRANHRLMTTPGAGAQGAFETEVTIFNDVWDNAQNMLRVSGGGGGGGDFSSNTATSVDSEVVLFSGTGGKTGKRAVGTGLATLTSGVLSTTAAPVGAVVGVSDTQTFTGKTYDVEATGNVFTSTHKIWMPGAGCQNATASLFWDTPVANAAVATCLTGTNVQKGVADFANSGVTAIQQTLVLPADWVGAVDVRFKWLTTAITGNMVWNIATVCVADAETDDPAFNTASQVTDGAKGTTNQTNDASITNITMTGCAAGELLHIRVFRDKGNGADTLAAVASLIGVELTIRRTQ